MVAKPTPRSDAGLRKLQASQGPQERALQHRQQQSRPQGESTREAGLFSGHAQAGVLTTVPGQPVSRPNPTGGRGAAYTLATTDAFILSLATHRHKLSSQASMVFCAGWGSQSCFSPSVPWSSARARALLRCQMVLWFKRFSPCNHAGVLLQRKFGDSGQGQGQMLEVLRPQGLPSGVMHGTSLTFWHQRPQQLRRGPMHYGVAVPAHAI